MADKSRRDRVGLGLIGVGPGWEERYRQPLMRLRHRMTIRLVYDPVEARSRSVAEEFEAEVAESLSQVVRRRSLQGLLVLDSGWSPSGLLAMVTQSDKPVFLAGSVLKNASGPLRGLHQQAALSSQREHVSKLDDLLMPELGLRFTPASCRLRELMATKLGAAKRIQMDCDLKADVAVFATHVDWCHEIMACSLNSGLRRIESGRSRPVIEFELPPRLVGSPSKNGHKPFGSKLSFNGTNGSSALPQHASHRSEGASRMVSFRQKDDDGIHPPITIECELGSAQLLDRTRIAWQTSAESAEESLTDERTEIEILIDQFCRRALGGLNPIGRLSDYAHALEIADSLSRDGL